MKEKLKQIRIQQWICVDKYNVIGIGLKIHGWVTYITIYDITFFWIRWDDMMFNI